MDTYPPGFEECEQTRSKFIRQVTLRQIEIETKSRAASSSAPCTIPKKLVRYWHDPAALPDDVQECLSSWDRLADHGFEFHRFSDASAAAYVAEVYGDRERAAFARCGHPAMRCDYLRLCFILEEGGFYVDADDVLLGDGWRDLFVDDALKLQPLCYDIPAGGMLQAAEIWRTDLPSEGRVFYVNNDPLVAPPGHPVIKRALDRATSKLLGDDPAPEIQSTTGPGNLTSALAAHARELDLTGAPHDFRLLRDWDAIAEMRWALSYRGDERNWRNVYGC
jgi:hypothetical protein